MLCRPLMRLLALLLAASLLLPSCRKNADDEDQPDGPPVVTSVKGTIAGKPVEFTHVTASIGYYLEDGVPMEAMLDFSRDPAHCGHSNDGKLVANTDQLSYRIRNNTGPDGKGVRLVRGSYPRGSQPFEGMVSMDGQYFRFDDACKPTLGDNDNYVSSGDVTVTRLKLSDWGRTGFIEGTISVRIGKKGEKLEGPFRAVVCENTQPGMTGADLLKERPPPPCLKLKL
jgi:hypothetical protein